MRPKSLMVRAIPTLTIMLKGKSDILKILKDVDGITPTDISQEVNNRHVQVKDQLAAPWGVAVFEVSAEGHDDNVTLTELSRVVGEARRVRQVSWCVTVVVVSDDLAFLTAFAQLSLKGRLLVWSTRLLVVTRLPLHHLQVLHTLLSSRNAILVHLNDTTTRFKCGMYVHLPYTPRETQPVWVASWTPKHGLALSSSLQLFPEKFYRFVQAPNLRVSVINMSAHNALLTVDPTDPTARRFIHTGPIANVVEYLATTLNFSYTNVVPRDYGFGTRADDGSWTGMVGMVQREEADISIGPISVTATRAEAVDFAWPFWYDSSGILSGLGRPEIDPWGFLAPLAPMVWVVILVTMTVVPLVELLCWSGLALNPSMWGRWLPNTFEHLRILLQQDPSLRENRWYERIVMVVWMMVALVLTRSYAGNLMALLAVRHVPQPYQTLQDVLNDPSAIMMWQRNSINAEYLRVVKSGSIYEAAQLERKGRLLYVTQEEYARLMATVIRAGTHVLFDISISLRNLIAKEYSLTGRCDFYTSKDKYLAFSASLITQKDNPLVPAVKYRMMALVEFGLFDRWFKTTVPNSTLCLRPPQKYTIQSSLSLTNLWGMLVVVVGGSTLSLLVLGAEIFWARGP
nr:probable glutamate receptor [Procambarus clarkii]